MQSILYTYIGGVFGAKVVLGSVCFAFGERKTLLIRKHIQFYKALYLTLLGRPALMQILEATTARHELLRGEPTKLVRHLRKSVHDAQPSRKQNITKDAVIIGSVCLFHRCGGSLIHNSIWPSKHGCSEKIYI